MHASVDKPGEPIIFWKARMESENSADDQYVKLKESKESDLLVRISLCLLLHYNCIMILVCV